MENQIEVEQIGLHAAMKGRTCLGFKFVQNQGLGNVAENLLLNLFT